MNDATEDEWLKEFIDLQKWQFGVDKTELRQIFSEIKNWTESPEGLCPGKQYTLFGSPAQLVFTFTNDGKLYRVTILWDSPTSGAYLLSKLNHIKKILDKTYGRSSHVEYSAIWQQNECCIELGMVEAENRLIMQIGVRDG